MSAAPLPPVLADKLTELATEVRRAVALRGLGWFILVVVGGAATAVSLDVLLELPGWIRGCMLVAWISAGAVVAGRQVIVPLRKDLPPEELAVLVESSYPGLAERLTTLVELSHHIEPANGSRALVSLLGAETERRAKRLDFTSVTPFREAMRVGVGAAVISVLLLSILVLVDGSAVWARRFVIPWYSPPVPIPYRLVISSGNPVVRRGDPVTLTAYLDRIEPGALLPDVGVLVVRTAGSGGEKVMPMTADSGAAFSLTRTGVTDSFEYRVQIGKAMSTWHAVTMVDPVALVDGTSVTISPPAYTGLALYRREGFTEFESLQFGMATLDLKFNIAPVEASLLWVPAVVTMSDVTRTVPLTFRADRLAATVVLPLTTEGTLRLMLTGDHDIRTEVPVAVHVVPDTPPRFVQVIGLADEIREARPDDVLPIDLTVSDDVRLAQLEFDYIVKDGVPRREPIPLAGVGTRLVEGHVGFSLMGKVPEGEVVRLRIRATDNRSDPDHRLEPQVAVYPPDRWITIHVTASARPLAEQQILTQRDRFLDKLAEAAKLVSAAATGTSRVQAQPTSGGLSPDQAVRLRDARDHAVAAARLLDALADESVAIPGLRDTAGEARAIAEGPIRGAETAIRSAEREPVAMTRGRSLSAASAHLYAASERLAQLIERTGQVARDRLDQKKLARLAEEQKALAMEARQPNVASAELVRKQRDLAERLAGEVAASEQLRAAVAAADVKNVKDLAARLRRLAEDAAALAHAAEQTDEAMRVERTRELARLQRELSERAAQLGKKTDTAARLAGTAPLADQPFDRARDQLGLGKPSDAAAEQEKAARELDRLAEALARAAQSRGDTKEAARQVARWQDDLRRRFEEANRSQPADSLLPSELQRFVEEQRAIRTVVDQLRLGTPIVEQRNAAQDVADAVVALDRAPATADQALKRATDALNRLTDALPSQLSRLHDARLRLDQLRKDQAEIGRQATDAPRAASMRERMGVAEAQEQLAQKIRDLDTPGHEARRDAAGRAAGRAAEDIRVGLMHDVPASQDEVRLRLDRLREALDGQTPADEQAAEVARLLRAAADATSEHSGSPTPEELKSLHELQREAARRLVGISAPEAVGPLATVRQAAENSDQALRKNEPRDELRKKTQEAARAAELLRDRLTGEESDQQRVQRLAREQILQAEATRMAAQQPPNAELTARAKRDAQRRKDELRRTRTGLAEQAKKDAEVALDRLANAATPDRQPELQQAAVDALDRLSRELIRNGDRDIPSAQPRPTEPSASDTLRRTTGGGKLPSDEDAETARELARLQRELRDAASRAAAELARVASPADAIARGELARRQQQQADLMSQVDQLVDSTRATEANTADPQAAGRLGQAIEAAARARDAMARAGRDGITGPREAAEMLRKAADATVGTPAEESGRVDPHAQAAGEAARQAAGQMRQAGAQLNLPEGRNAATGAMQRAADSLDRAARSLTPSTGDGTAGMTPGTNRTTPDANIRSRAMPRTPHDLPQEVVPYIGKPWGELPGNVKDRILQEVAAKYGDDYARTIRWYFEQVANRR